MYILYAIYDYDMRSVKCSLCLTFKVLNTDTKAESLTQKSLRIMGYIKYIRFHFVLFAYINKQRAGNVVFKRFSGIWG